MKIAKNKLSQKILIVICVMLMLFNFAAPVVNATNDDNDGGIGGVLLEPIQKFTVFIGDSATWLMQYIFYGDSSLVTEKVDIGGIADAPKSVELIAKLLNIGYGTDTTEFILSKIIQKLTNGKASLVDVFYTIFHGNTIEIPNIKISPESIFSNKIPAFDINFFHPIDDIENTDEKEIDISDWGKFLNCIKDGTINASDYKKKLEDKYSEYVQDEDEINAFSDMIEENSVGAADLLYKIMQAQSNGEFSNSTGLGKITISNKVNTRGSSARILQSTVSYWYNLLRNIAIIGLLSVLVYIGIRIVIASTAADKSKYKEMIKDWAIALCLLFFMHYLMSFIVTATSTLSSALGNTSETDQLIGNARLLLQTGTLLQQMSYTIIYLVLVIYTVVFALMYLKRVIYMAFLTIVSPLVALTYPLDKIRDGKAQAFDMWMKEYVFNALLQPFHLILYYVIVGASLDLAIDNPLYALVAIGFMLPAEKLLRKFFGFNKSETSGALGGMLGGAMVMQGINALSKRVKGGAGAKGGKPDANEKDRNKPIRTANSGNNTAKLMDEIASENPDASQENGSGEIRTGASDANNSQQIRNDEEQGFRAEDGDYWNPRDEYANNIDNDNNEQGFMAEDGSYYWNPRDEYDDDSIRTQEQPVTEGDEELEEDSQTPQYQEISDEKRFARAIGGTALRYTGKIGLGALKLAAKGTAAATLGTIGVAAGLASDDYTNVVKWGAAGAIAGNMAAKSAMNKLPSSAYRVKAAVERERDRFEQEAYSKSKRKEIANDRADRMFLRDKQVIKRYYDEFGEAEYKQAMQDALKYREYGVTDNDTIIKSMKLTTRGLGGRDNRKRILVAKTATQLNRKDVDSFGDRLIANRFSQRDAENMKQAIRDFNDWE